ncbi:MAG: hypothetical protein JO324_02945 [Candidatus Eremiobacteraeota bacterium]|nr:hypothetical protein [Candidatus Eremiobacteraeota bacterium]
MKRLTVIALGAAGGSGKRFRGRGGRIFAVIPVTPGEQLVVFVGGQGGQPNGGYNGGGAGVYGTDTSYGGGGASDVRESGDKLRDRILVVGGGGGQGTFFGDVDGKHGAGGAGGGTTAGSGRDGKGMITRGYTTAGEGGGGGTHYGGGLGGAGGGGGYQYGHSGSNGKPAHGGSGGVGTGENGGGGGGGGYYGGGGGGGGGWAYGDYFGGGGGGGGGSSFITPRATQFQQWQGWYKATGNGLVVFDW